MNENLNNKKEQNKALLFIIVLTSSFVIISDERRNFDKSQNFIRIKIEYFSNKSAFWNSYM